MRPNIRVDVEETTGNGEYRWLVVVVDTEVPESRPIQDRRAVIYGARSEDEAIEVSHASMSAIHRVWKWWGHGS